MRRSSLLAVLMSPAIAAMLAGCGSSAPPPAPLKAAPVGATPEQAYAAQSDMMKLDPNAKVGHVAAYNPSAGMASVTGIPASDVHVGDTLVFTDANKIPVGNGTIRSIDTTTSADFQFLIVDYKANQSGRDLIRNDLAVYLPPTH